jgi:protein TonB
MERHPRWLSAAVFVLVASAHALALWALWSYAPARAALETTVTLMVSLVEPQPRPAPPRPAPQPLPVKPKPKPKAKPEPQPVKAPEPPLLAVPEEVPAPVAPPVEAPVAKAPEAPPVEAPAAPPAEAPPAPPPSLVPPRFDADYLLNPPPEYPALSRRLGEAGQVLLRVRVSAEGLPLAVELKRSSGFPRLDEAARAAVERWRFVPARRGERPVEAWVLIPISFTLRG